MGLRLLLRALLLLLLAHLRLQLLETQQLLLLPGRQW